MNYIAVAFVFVVFIKGYAASCKEHGVAGHYRGGDSEQAGVCSGPDNKENIRN